MKKRFLRITSLLAMAVFFMASYVEATAQSDVSLPVDVGGMEKYGYDFTGFSMDKESLLTMMDASIKGLNKAIKECDDEARKSELSGRVEALSRAYDVVSASDKERYFLTDEEGNLITGSGSLYKILGYMRGGVESLEIDAEWDMTPREIVISGNGNSALVYYKDGKFYSDREAETEVFNVGDVGGRIVTSDSSEGHYKGVYLASGLELVDTDGNLIIDDDLASAIEAELKLTASADYYLHLQVIRSDGAGSGSGSGDGGAGDGSGGGSGSVKEAPIDLYYYDDVLYHDLGYSDRADSIDIPSSGDEDGDGAGVNARTWKLIDMITDAFGESYIYSLVELKPVIGERVTEIEVIEPEDDSDDSDDSGSGDDADGAGSDGSGADGRAASDDDSSDEELIPTIIVHTEDYLQGYVATNRDDSAIFVVSADGSIDYDNTDIDEETVDVDSIKEETLARWLEEKEAERRAAEEEEEAAAAASSGLSIEDAAAVASSDEAGLASSDESDEAGLAASEGASGPSDAANEGMSGDGAGTGDAIGDSVGTGAGNEDAAGSDQLGGEGNGDGNDDALAGGNDGDDDNDDALDNSGDDGNDDSSSGDDAGDSGDSGDDGDDDDGGETVSEDAAPTEEYHGDEGDSGDGGSGDGDGDDSE
ncbi:MAG: hypothetical protein IKO84_07460 [Butyrivibrio sp.]|nr:hypothetical protein [Butyrivibrio sp.]